MEDGWIVADFFALFLHELFTCVEQASFFRRNASFLV